MLLENLVETSRFLGTEKPHAIPHYQRKDAVELTWVERNSVDDYFRADRTLEEPLLVCFAPK
jgi:hypothetical protein